MDFVKTEQVNFAILSALKFIAQIAHHQLVVIIIITTHRQPITVLFFSCRVI